MLRSAPRRSPSGAPSPAARCPSCSRPTPSWPLPSLSCFRLLSSLSSLLSRVFVDARGLEPRTIPLALCPLVADVEAAALR